MSHSVNNYHQFTRRGNEFCPDSMRPEWQLSHSARHGNNRKMYAKLKRQGVRASRKQEDREWRREEGLL